MWRLRCRNKSQIDRTKLERGEKKWYTSIREPAEMYSGRNHMRKTERKALAGLVVLGTVDSEAGVFQETE